jgi:tryptophanyl-tRNA synthetase
MLMKLVSDENVLNKFNTDYNNCNIRYGDMKKQLAEDMIQFIAPIRQKTNDILENNEFLTDVMKKGAAKAGESAKKTMKLVREAIGLNYF